MGYTKVAAVVVAGWLAFVGVHVTLDGQSRARLYRGAVPSRLERAEPLRDIKYFHHAYGNSARDLSNASVLCGPEQWHSKYWHSESPAPGEHLFASHKLLSKKYGNTSILRIAAYKSSCCTPWMELANTG